MSKNTLLIDNIAFSKKSDHIEGQLSIQDCPRLMEMIQSSNISQSGLINYILQGKTDAVGQHILQLSIICEFNTLCQRCLNAMPLKLILNFNYLIGEISDTDVEEVDLDNNDDYDLQQANKAMDLIALIEDEIIMAIPIAPMHKDGCTDIAMNSGEKLNPFAVLKGLIKP